LKSPPPPFSSTSIESFKFAKLIAEIHSENTNLSVSIASLAVNIPSVAPSFKLEDNRIGLALSVIAIAAPASTSTKKFHAKSLIGLPFPELV